MIFYILCMSEMSVDGYGAVKEGRADHSSQSISCYWLCQLGRTLMITKNRKLQDGGGLALCF